MAKRQIYVSTGSGNGSSPGQCKANYWANKLLWKIQNSFQESDLKKKLFCKILAIIKIVLGQLCKAAI